MLRAFAWEPVRSAGLFVWGVARQFYVWVAAVLLDPFDWIERATSYLPSDYHVRIEPPTWLAVSAMASLLTIAAIRVYHLERMKATARHTTASKNAEMLQLGLDTIILISGAPVQSDELPQWRRHMDSSLIVMEQMLSNVRPKAGDVFRAASRAHALTLGNTDYNEQRTAMLAIPWFKDYVEKFIAKNC